MLNYILSYIEYVTIKWTCYLCFQVLLDYYYYYYYHY